MGADFERDPDGTLCMSPKTYIEKRLTSSYVRMFGENPSTRYHAPLEHGDHPELDTSELLEQDGIDQYQSLLVPYSGYLLWGDLISKLLSCHYPPSVLLQDVDISIDSSVFVDILQR